MEVRFTCPGPVLLFSAFGNDLDAGTGGTKRGRAANKSEGFNR